MQTKIQKWGDSLALRIPKSFAEETGVGALAPKECNRKVGLALFCPITSRSKGYPFEVRLPEGFAVEGVVLCDQIKSLDWWARRTQRITTVPCLGARRSGAMSSPQAGRPRGEISRPRCFQGPPRFDCGEGMELSTRTRVRFPPPPPHNSVSSCQLVFIEAAPTFRLGAGCSRNEALSLLPRVAPALQFEGSAPRCQASG